MSESIITLWINSETNTLLPSWNSFGTAVIPAIKQGDLAKIEVHWIKSDSSGNFMQEIEMSPTATLKVAVGSTSGIPTGGYFTYNYQGDTVEIPFDATAQQAGTLINSLPSIISAGGVSVSIVNQRTIRIVFNQFGVRALSSCDSTTLTPSTNILVTRINTGSANSKEVHHLRPKLLPIAYSDSFSDSPLPTISITDIDSITKRVSIYPFPKYGTFTISNGVNTTNALSINSSSSDILNALSTAGISSSTRVYSVAKSGEYSWDIYRTSGTAETLTVSDSGIVGFSSKYGVIDFNTIEVEDYLGGNASASAIIEVEYSDGNIKHTIYQGTISIVNDLIENAVYSPIPFPELNGGIGDAPQDGILYGRKDGIWSAVIGDGNNIPDYDNGITYSVGSQVYYQGSLYRMTISVGGAGYDPVNYPSYWESLSGYPYSNPSGYIQDANSDGNFYARKDGQWEVFSSNDYLPLSGGTMDDLANINLSWLANFSVASLKGDGLYFESTEGYSYPNTKASYLMNTCYLENDDGVAGIQGGILFAQSRKLAPENGGNYENAVQISGDGISFSHQYGTSIPSVANRGITFPDATKQITAWIDAPSNGNIYARQNGSWVTFSATGNYLPLSGGAMDDNSSISIVALDSNLNPLSQSYIAGDKFQISDSIDPYAKSIINKGQISVQNEDGSITVSPTEIFFPDGTSLPTGIGVNLWASIDSFGGFAKKTWVSASYAPLNSPALTGVPTAPTPLATDNSTTIATTAYVTGAIATATTSVSTEKVIMSVLNQTGSTITAGSVVYIISANGTNPTIALAKADSELTSYRTLGMTANDILNGSTGTVVLIGNVTNLNTNSFNEGDQLYLSPTVAGGVTNSKPSAPYHMVYVGVCVRKNLNNGVIQVRVANGYELGELHNVSVPNNPADNEILAYELSSSLWKNKTASALGLVDTSSTQTITGTKTFSGFGININNTNIQIGSLNTSQLVQIGVGSTMAGSTKNIEIGTNGIAGSTTNITIGPSSGSSTNLIRGLTSFSNKTTFTSVGGAAGINIGIGGVATTATNAGDIWISTGGTALNYRDATGAWRILATQGQTNTFSSPQVIDTTSNTLAGLRVTQKGTMPALVVEDSLNPDTSSFVVDASGNVGIGVDPATWVAGNKLEVSGAIISTTAANKTNSTVVATTAFVKNSIVPTIATISSSYSITNALNWNSVLRCTAPSAITINVPYDTTSNVEIGTQIVVIQTTVGGQVTFYPEAGVALMSSGSRYKTNGQYSVCTLIKTASNEWVLGGDLIA